MNITLNRYLNYALLALAFFIPWGRTGVSISVGAVLLLWIAEGGWKEKWALLSKDRLALIIGVFILYYCSTVLWSGDLNLSIRSLKNYGHFLLVPVFITSFDRRFSERLNYAFLAGIGLTVAVSYLYYFQVLTSPNVDPANPRVFMHHLDYNMMLAFYVLFLLNLLWTDKTGLKVALKNPVNHENKMIVLAAVLKFVIFVLTFILLFIVQGRGGQLAFIVTFPLFVLFLFPAGKRVFGALAGIVLVACIIFGTYKLSANFNSRTNQSINAIKQIFINKDYTGSWGKRFHAWLVASEIIAKNPVFGVGVGDSLTEFNKTMDEKYPNQPELLKEFRHTHMHNQYVQTMLEAGALGLILFFGVFIFFLKNQDINLPGGRMGWVLIVLFLTGFIGEPFMRNQLPSALFAYFLGYLMSAENL